ncbi:MAG: DUF1295 domain-containing protein, partial [Chitinophagales bacterium]
MGNFGKGLLWTFIAYLLAVLAAWWSIENIDAGNIYLNIFIADAIGTIVIFLFSFFFKNSSFYDPYWSVAPIFIMAWLIHIAPESIPQVRQMLVALLVFVWGARLTYNFYRGWPGIHKQDWRYDDLQEKNGKWYWPVSFSGIHFFPTILVFLGCLSLFPALCFGENATNVFDWIGTFVGFSAIAIETISDQQLHDYVKSKPDKSKVFKSGLWQYSRHPNYFGEILFWWALYVFALAAGLEYWWCFIGPLSITLLFKFISIPMMDERMVKRRPAYRAHMEKVNALFP